MAAAEPTPLPEAATKQPADTTKAAAPDESQLPKLSAEEFRVYNRLAEMMDAYHNHFRRTWQMLYDSCSSGNRPSGFSMRSFLASGLQLVQHLNVHHNIEEQYIFPELAERMPIFGANDHLIKQHEQIHEGLIKFEQYLRDCLYGERELRMSEMKDVMDSFGEVLWNHLGLEVEMLGAENMRKFWSPAEMNSMHW